MSFEISMYSPVKIWRSKKYKLAGSNPGRLLSFSIIHASPPGFKDQAPYSVGLVELKNGLRVIGQIVEAESLKIGQKMKAVFRIFNPQEKEGVIYYGIKFKPWKK